MAKHCARYEIDKNVTVDVHPKVPVFTSYKTDSDKDARNTTSGVSKTWWKTIPKDTSVLNTYFAPWCTHKGLRLPGKHVDTFKAHEHAGLKRDIAKHAVSIYDAIKKKQHGDGLIPIQKAGLPIDQPYMMDISHVAGIIPAKKNMYVRKDLDTQKRLSIKDYLRGEYELTRPTEANKMLANHLQCPTNSNIIGAVAFYVVANHVGKDAVSVTTVKGGQKNHVGRTETFHKDLGLNHNVFGVLYVKKHSQTNTQLGLASVQTIKKPPYYRYKNKTNKQIEDENQVDDDKWSEPPFIDLQNGDQGLVKPPVPNDASKRIFKAFGFDVDGGDDTFWVNGIPVYGGGKMLVDESSSIVNLAQYADGDDRIVHQPWVFYIRIDKPIRKPTLQKKAVDYAWMMMSLEDQMEEMASDEDRLNAFIRQIDNKRISRSPRRHLLDYAPDRGGIVSNEISREYFRRLIDAGQYPTANTDYIMEADDLTTSYRETVSDHVNPHPDKDDFVTLDGMGRMFVTGSEKHAYDRDPDQMTYSYYNCGNSNKSMDPMGVKFLTANLFSTNDGVDHGLTKVRTPLAASKLWTDAYRIFRSMISEVFDSSPPKPMRRPDKITLLQGYKHLEPHFFGEELSSPIVMKKQLSRLHKLYDTHDMNRKTFQHWIQNHTDASTIRDTAYCMVHAVFMHRGRPYIIDYDHEGPLEPVTVLDRVIRLAGLSVFLESLSSESGIVGNLTANKHTNLVNTDDIRSTILKSVDIARQDWVPDDVGEHVADTLETNIENVEELEEELS